MSKDLPNNPRFLPGRGSPTDIRELRRMEELASRTEKASAGGGMGSLTGSDGLSFFDQSPASFYIRLTGSYSAPYDFLYSWKAMRRRREDLVWEDDDQIQPGDLNNVPAHAMNNQTGIPADPSSGAIVHAWLSSNGQSLEFQYTPGPNDPTNYNNTNINYINTSIHTPYGPTISTGPTNTNNVPLPPGWVNSILVTGKPNWTGMVAGACGRRLLFVVMGDDVDDGLILKHEDPASDAVNRFHCFHEQDLVVPTDHAFELMYDCDINRWRVLWVSYVFNPKADTVIPDVETWNNYPFNLETPTILLDLTTNLEITGLANGVDGYIRRISSVYTTPDLYRITLKHLNGGSSAENQIVTPNGADFVIPSGGGVILYYFNQKWRVLAIREIYNTPNKLIAVGGNKLPEEKAELEIKNDRELRVIKQDGVNRPEMALLRQGSSSSNLSGGEELGVYSLKGRVAGDDKEIGSIKSNYGGTGLQQTGDLKGSAWNAGSENTGWIVHPSGKMEFPGANTAFKVLQTDGSGQVIADDFPVTLGQLLNVDDAVDTAAANNLLMYNGSEWIAWEPDFPYNLDELLDTSIGTTNPLNSYDFLMWDGTDWLNTPLYLDYLYDVIISGSQATGDVLTWNGTNWEDAPLGDAVEAAAGTLFDDSSTIDVQFTTGSITWHVKSSSISDTHIATSIGPTKGGTGLTSYATGDMIYASATNTLAKLAAGTNGKYLRLVGGLPVWTAIPGELLGWDNSDADESTNSATPVALTTADEIAWTSIEAENVVVEYDAQTYNTSVANNSVRLLLDSGTVTTRTQGQANANVVTGIRLVCKFGVSSGSHTIAMRYFTDAGNIHMLFRTLRLYRGN